MVTLLDSMVRTFGCAEVQHVAVLPEHVNLLDPRDGLDVELLERALELLVVLRSSRLRLPNDLSTDSPLSTYARGSRAPNMTFSRSGGARAHDADSELTDPVGRRRSLQLCQFRGIHC